MEPNKKPTSPKMGDKQKNKESKADKNQRESILQLQKSLKDMEKDLNDQKTRTKLYKKKVQDLEEKLTASMKRVVEDQGKGVIKQTQDDYARLVRRCVTYIDEYEAEIVEMRRYIRKLESENKELKNMEKLQQVPRVSTASISTGLEHKEHEHVHGSPMEIQLKHEVDRLKKAITITQTNAKDNEERLKKDIKVLQSKVHELRQTEKDKEAKIAQLGRKQNDRLEREVRNLKLQLEKSQQLIKEFTEQKFRELHKPPGGTNTMLNIKKNITKIFTDVEKELAPGKALASSLVKNILQKIRINIELLLDKP